MHDNMKDFPCLYYLHSHAGRENQIQFYLMLASMFGQTQEQALIKSEFFSHTSGKLFDGTGITGDEVVALSKNVFEKPYKDCRGFYRRKLLSDIGLKDNCCPICVYSHGYLNSCLGIEREILRAIMADRSQIQSLSCNASDFVSVLPVSCTNDISELPIVPFNRIFFNYLLETDTEVTAENVTAYVSHVLEAGDIYIAKDKLATFVRMQLGIISKLEVPDSVALSFRFTELQASPKYIPPQIVRPASAEPEKSRKRNRELSNDINSLSSILDAADNIVYSGQNDNSAVPNGNAQVVAEETAEPLQESPNEPTHESDIGLADECAEPENVPDTPTSAEPSAHSEEDIPTELPEDVPDYSADDSDGSATPAAKNDSEDTSETRTVPPADAVAPVSAETSAEDTPVSQKPSSEPGSSLYADEPMTITDDFWKYITACVSTSADMAGLISFIEKCAKSTEIAVELVRYKGMPGLLFLVDGSYFFVAYSCERFLRSLFSDAEKVTFYSMNPIPVHATLMRFGIRHAKIESLAVLYSIANDWKKPSAPENMFQTDRRMDLLRSIMPQYATVYRKTIWGTKAVKNIKECFTERVGEHILMDDEHSKKYEACRKLEWALAYSRDTSFIVSDTNTSVLGTNALNYRFAPFDCEKIQRAGSLFIVRLSSESELPTEEKKAFWEDVSGRLAASNRSCIGYAFLIALGNGVGYYSTFEEEAFFDSLMASARSAYRHRYGKEVSLQVSKETYIR